MTVKDPRLHSVLIEKFTDELATRLVPRQTPFIKMEPQTPKEFTTVYAALAQEPVTTEGCED